MRASPRRAEATDRWTRIAAIASSVTAAAVMVALLAGWRVLGPAEWAPLPTIEHACTTSTSEATCIFTNPTGRAVKSCARLRVSKKDESTSVSSINVCTGRLDSYESKTVVMPWPASIVEVCTGPQGHFDWKNCTFATEPAEGR